MNIGIGDNRWVKFTRDPHGEWYGKGHGYRFRVTRSRGTYGSPQWLCRVWAVSGGVTIASCKFHKMKSAIQEGARLADVATTEAPCPT
jgi:hypothetical protein